MTRYSVELSREHWKVLKGIIKAAMETTQSQQELDRLKVVMNAMEMAGFRASYQEMKAADGLIESKPMNANFADIWSETICPYKLKP